MLVVEINVIGLVSSYISLISSKELCLQYYNSLLKSMECCVILKL